MRIYTGRGDAGDTDLMDQSRVSKANPRIEAYGTVDELNALIGVVRPTGEDDVDDRLRSVQNHLHVVQAELANPDGDGPRMDESRTETLEEWIDGMADDLPTLDRFILPTGSEAGAALHHARTVCRRAERRVVALAEQEDVAEAVIAYLNRLSDALFTAARLLNHRDGVGEEHPTY